MRILLIFLFFLSFITNAVAQTPWPFENEIRNFEKEDRFNPPKKQQILFIGSSSIRLWADFDERFKDYPVIRRGFGGSELSDVVHYAKRILIPYQPSKVFIYVGENDIARNQGVEQAYKEFLDLYRVVSENLPDTRVYYISAKPSPKLKEYKNQLEEFNRKVKSFISSKGCSWTFIDVYHAMLASNGLPLQGIYLKDQLHLNSKGYDIWEKLIKRHLGEK